MECTQGNLSALFTGFKATFMEVLKAAEPPDGLGDFCTEVPSNTSVEQYPAAGILGGLEYLLDELSYTAVADFVQSVANSTFARGLEIPRSKIEDDQTGMYRIAIQELARAAALDPYDRVPALFLLGFTTAWIDGANLFSDGHTWPGGQTWDNLENRPLTHTDYRIARRHLRERVGPNGKPMRLKPTHLIVGPALETRARTILEAEHLANGATNVDTFDNVRPTVWSDLTNNARLGIDASYYWFLVAAAQGRKPVVIQNRRAAALDAQDQPTDEPVFNRERYQYKASCRYQVAMVLPHLIQASQATEDTTTTTAA